MSDGKGIVYAAALGVWLVFLVIAFALGTMRDLLLAPLVGGAAGHVLGTLVAVAAFLAVITMFLRRVRHHCSSGDVWWVGLLWLVLTVAFEFLFFHYVGSKPWEELLADYDVTNGRLWVLVPATTLFGPPVVAAVLRRSCRGRRSTSERARRS